MALHRLNPFNIHAACFQRAQSKECVAHLHGQWLAPTGAATQHVHRFAGDKADFSQAAQQGGISTKQDARLGFMA
jgi:hypothetical protein